MATTLHSVCALDCPDACSLLINVDENGRGSKLRGNPAHPVTRGFLCGKVARYLDREYSPDRILHPLRRIGAKGEGRFERISWDAALDEIARKLTAASNDFGPESILPYSYAGTMGYLNGSGMDRRFFHRLGASRLDRTICSSAGTVGLTEALGVRYAIEPEDFRHAKLILAWGANILGTNVHLWPFIVEARRNGASFYTIDPHRNRTGKLSDRHYSIHPGTDTALALAMMHVITAEGLEDRDYVDRYTLGFPELKEKVRELDSRTRRRTHRHPRRRHRPARPRVRHHATRRHSSQLRRAAFRTRSQGRPHHSSAARAHRRLARRRWRSATLHLRSLPVQPDRSRTSRPPILIASQTRVPHRQHDRTGQRSDHPQRPAGQSHGGLQFQPSRHCP